MNCIGIDLGKLHLQVCELGENGELWEKRIRTDRDRIVEVFTARARGRVLLEACTDSEWVARLLETLGYEVIVADPNYAPMYGQRNRRVKTDRRDALALAQACRISAYRPAHRTSDPRRHVRGLLAVRDNLGARSDARREGREWHSVPAALHSAVSTGTIHGRRHLSHIRSSAGRGNSGLRAFRRSIFRGDP